MSGYDRIPRRDDRFMVPRPTDHGRFEVDATWGTVQPMTLAPGVVTLGELELIAHVEAGGPLLDTRLAEHFEQGTIPGAIHRPHTATDAWMAELDPAVPAALFCNGPQCKATADAVETLLQAGHPPSAIRYYRGGIHDWMTLGYPLEQG